MEDTTIVRRRTRVPQPRLQERLAGAAKQYAIGTLFALIDRRLGDSINTRDAYRRGFERWIHYCKDRDIDVLNPPKHHEQEWVVSMSLEGLAAGSIATAVAPVRFFYRELARLGYYRIPFWDVELPEDHAEGRTPYAAHEVRLLMRAADVPERVVIAWHVELNRRIDELLKMRWEDHAHGRWRASTGPAVLIPSGMMDDMLRLGTGPHEGRVMPFGSKTRARQRMAALCEDCGVEYRGLDVLRMLYGNAIRGEDADAN